MPPIIWAIARKYLKDVAVSFGVSVLSSLVFGSGEAKNCKPICPTCVSSDTYYSDSSSSTNSPSARPYQPINWNDNPYAEQSRKEIEDYVDKLEFIQEPLTLTDLKVGYYTGTYDNQPASLEITNKRENNGIIYFDYIILTSNEDNDINGIGKYDISNGAIDIGFNYPTGKLYKMKFKKSLRTLLLINSNKTNNQSLQFTYNERA